MTTTQFYREPMSVEDASFEIEKGANRKYDPKLVEAFKKALPVMTKVREAYSDKLGDLINLDFAPKGAAPAAPKPSAAAAPAAVPKPAAAPAAKPRLSAAELAARAAAKRK
jgi:hypothetical protein